MPAYLKQRHGMSVTEQGWYSGFAFGGMSVVIVLAGWAADRLIARGFDPVTVRKCFTIAGFLLATTQTLVDCLKVILHIGKTSSLYAL